MRIAFTLMLLFVVTLTTNADTGRRGRWRTAPPRTWRVFDGYNVRQPGWESSYYSPYTQGNTITTGTPTPVTGQWQSETTFPNAIPNTTWTNGTTTPTHTPTPNGTTNPSSTQYFNRIPNVQSELVPSATGQPTTTTTTTPTDTTRSTSRRPSSSASFQLQTPQSNYWNNLNGGNK